MKAKLFLTVIFILSIYNNYLFPQTNIFINGGVSIATAGIGGNVEIFLSKKFAGTVGIGYMLEDISWSVGGRYYFKSNSSSFYLGSTFSPLAGVTHSIGGVEIESKTLYGPSFFVGYRIFLSKNVVLNLGGGISYIIDSPEWSSTEIIFAPDLTLGISL